MKVYSFVYKTPYYWDCHCSFPNAYLCMILLFLVKHLVMLSHCLLPPTFGTRMIFKSGQRIVRNDC